MFDKSIPNLVLAPIFTLKLLNHILLAISAEGLCLLYPHPFSLGVRSNSCCQLILFLNLIIFSMSLYNTNNNLFKLLLVASFANMSLCSLPRISLCPLYPNNFYYSVIFNDFFYIIQHFQY